MDPNFTRIDMAEIARICMSFSSNRADKGMITLKADIPDDLSEVYADHRMMRQMILNLLSNAIKFTPKLGTVELTIAVDQEQGCVVRVRDDGIGMDPANLDVVMQPFGQIESVLNRRFEGTGLGLPLVKSMVEMHNGTLVIDTALDQGTTATITLPPEAVIEDIRQFLD